ncbi:MAG TPA: TonB-dependent receptor [Candidatus Koribacter sp.]|jgi:hypothetical protein
MNRPTGVSLGRVLLGVLLFCLCGFAQDASTVAIHGTIADSSGARIVGAQVSVVNPVRGLARSVATDAQGRFTIEMLPPGDYFVRVKATGMGMQEQEVHPQIGGTAKIDFVLLPGMVRNQVEVASRATIVDTVASDVSHVIDEKTIDETPLNGRRFTDLALLTPGVTQDPRSLTSGSNGDLAFGGIRGYHTSFLVDGADFNNGFFSQEQGRYRTPYQFSNDVVQEFRVSSNAYGAETGRAGGAVINVATKSGTNQLHGSMFADYRDTQLGATYPFTGVKPTGDQKQYGLTVGGPIRQNKLFFFAGWDEHDYSDPNVVRFLNGESAVTPTPLDYDYLDQALVTQQAAQLSAKGGDYHASLKGGAKFVKLDDVLSKKNYLSLRWNASNFSGANNVFFDPGNPVTSSLQSDNGEEKVDTDSLLATLTSSITSRLTSHGRLQFARDLEQSFANSDDARTEIYGIVDGFGRSTILPRQTREHRLHAAETLSYTRGRNDWKFGADGLLTWDYNFFPSMFGGEYIFDTIRVNPWTFAPETYGEHLTPLRAYAHDVPRYYLQSFGTAASHPDTREYAAFAQDSVRLTSRLALSLGLRYDLQTYPASGLEENPAWPTSGKMPSPKNNFAPRAALAYALGNHHPLMVRAGYGWFYTRIPQIYESSVMTGNGLGQSFLFLDNQKALPGQFPTYPNPLVNCGPTATSCLPPANVSSALTSEIYAFDPNFHTPMVQQASFTLEKELPSRVVVATTYLYVHGEHMLRAVDANLPTPEIVTYPVYEGDGTTPTGQIVQEASFGTWQMTRSMTCPYPPCVNDVQRPIPTVGAINVYQSAASSLYNGLTVSARKQMGRGYSFQMAYTYAKAIDDGQDALVAGAPSTVQNPYALKTDRGLSTTDQRQRFVIQAVAEPRFRVSAPLAKALVKNWKLSQVTTIGSGRPVSALVSGDANADSNIGNDRLPGIGRNSLTGPDYASTEMRLTKLLRITARYKLELMAEGFNVMNRDNKKLTTTDNGFATTAADFQYYSGVLKATNYPARYVLNSSFMRAQSSYIPRQVQFSAKLKF